MEQETFKTLSVNISETKQAVESIVELIQQGNITVNQQEQLIVTLEEGLGDFFLEIPLPLQKQLVASLIKFLDVVSPQIADKALEGLSFVLQNYKAHDEVRKVRLG
jgi:hypothetical protein